MRVNYTNNRTKGPSCDLSACAPIDKLGSRFRIIAVVHKLFIKLSRKG